MAAGRFPDKRELLVAGPETLSRRLAGVGLAAATTAALAALDELRAASASLG